MGPMARYDFYGGAKVAAFTYQGCVLEVVGNCKVEYVAKETPMNTVLNLHLALHNLRANAEDNTVGPRSIIIGPPDCGKTTTARILASYAVRNGRHPLFVDLDPNDVSA
eukprot:Partr_v1_DN26594_c1_g1_i4_m3970 putative Cleavage and polyadenylation factor